MEKYGVKEVSNVAEDREMEAELCEDVGVARSRERGNSIGCAILPPQVLTDFSWCSWA